MRNLEYNPRHSVSVQPIFFFIHIEQRVIWWLDHKQNEGLEIHSHCLHSREAALHHIKLMWLRLFKGALWKSGINERVGISLVWRYLFFLSLSLTTCRNWFVKSWKITRSWRNSFTISLKKTSVKSEHKSFLPLLKWDTWQQLPLSVLQGLCVYQELQQNF